MAVLTINLDPLNRTGGHLQAAVEVEKGKVVDAHVCGGMYRGFESILKNRNPRDVVQLVQRLCGSCGLGHSIAAAQALEQMGTVKVPANGRILRNLMLGANYLHAHIQHFYLLALPDYVPGPKNRLYAGSYAKPDLNLPRDLARKARDQYLAAFEVCATCQEMVALFGGRMPHPVGLVTGGTAEIPTTASVLEYAGRVKKVRDFTEEQYLPMVYALAERYKAMRSMGRGYRNVMCVGAFAQDDNGKKPLFAPGVYINDKELPFDASLIRQDVKHAWYASVEDTPTGAASLPKFTHRPDAVKPGGYSFVKAANYAGNPMEVGALARLWINNLALSIAGRRFAKDQLGITAVRFRDLGAELAFSVMGRHIARAEETAFLLNTIETWLPQLNPGDLTYVEPVLPPNGEGIGFVETPHGSTVHYLRARDARIDAYVIMSASMWNCAPRNDSGACGPMEQALVGTAVPDAANPVNLGRVVRSFAPCAACAAH